MSKVVHVILYIPLMFAAFFLIFWIKIVQNEKVAFDEFVLEKQANYAADAAVEELLFTGKLDQDYNKGEYILVDPELGKDEFISILEYSYGFIPSEYSDSMFMNKYLRALVICGWDGYYTYWRMPKDGDEYDLVATPKVPYFYTDKEGTQWCLNLGLEEAWASGIERSDSSYTMDTYKSIHDLANKYTSDHAPTKAEQLTAINNQVGDALNYALFQSYSDGHMQKTYSIPDMASRVKGAQPVDRITVIGVVEGADSSTATTIIAECIGGAQIVENDQVYAVHIENFRGNQGTTVAVYATASQWKKQGYNGDQLQAGGLAPGLGYIKDATYYDNCFDAAEAGYSDLMIQ